MSGMDDMRRHGYYTNEEVVRALRRLADDIDEPGADVWDSEGIRFAMVEILERIDQERAATRSTA